MFVVFWLLVLFVIWLVSCCVLFDWFGLLVVWFRLVLVSCWWVVLIWFFCWFSFWCGLCVDFVYLLILVCVLLVFVALLIVCGFGLVLCCCICWLITCLFNFAFVLFCGVAFVTFDLRWVVVCRSEVVFYVLGFLLIFACYLFVMLWFWLLICLI